jgi:hypothetical protein
VIAAFFVYEFFSTRDSYRNNVKGYDVTDSIPAEYLLMIKKSDSLKIKPVISYFPSNKFPISLFDYNEKYTIIIHKLVKNIFKPLNKNVTILRHSLKAATGVNYGVVNENIFELNYNLDDSAKYDLPILLNLSGDSISVLRQTDSLVAYYLRFNHISLSFEGTKHPYFYIESKINFPSAYKIPALIYLAEKQGNLYFILVSINSKNQTLSPSLSEQVFGFLD